MELAIAAAFLVGAFVGMFVGTLIISLCAMAGRDDRALEPVFSSAAK